MLCKDCKYFKIVNRPENHKLGEAVCEYYDLTVNFQSNRKLETLNCVKNTEISLEDCINNLKQGKSIPRKRETLKKAIDSLQNWDKLFMYLNDYRLGIAPDESTPEEEVHDREIIRDTIDGIMEEMLNWEGK